MEQFLLAVRRKCAVHFLIFTALVLVLSTTAFAAAEASSPLLISEIDGVIIDYEVNPGFGWYYSAEYSADGYDAYIAGNSFTNEANVSNIAVTVTGAGVLSFDYKISTGEGEAYALYYNLNSPIDSINYQSARNYSQHTAFSGVVDWANVELAITAGDLNEDGQATVYIAYYRGGIDVQNENVAAIANMCFIADEDPALVEGDESVDPFEGDGIEDNTEPDIESTIEDDIDELDTESEYNDAADPEVSADIELPENGDSLELQMFGSFDLLQTGGGDPDHPLVHSDSASVNINYEVNEGFAWYYNPTYSKAGYDAYIAGNSFSNQANVSNIAITVNGPGVFSFDYRVSTSSSGSSYALYYNINNPIDASNYTSAKNHSQYMSFRGIVDWTNVEFNITAEDLNEDGQATVYIAYYRGGTFVDNENMVAIANVCFISGQKTLTLNVEGSGYGHVTDTDGNTYSEGKSTIYYESGDTVTLTAVPENGGRFYGWVDGRDNFLTNNTTYSFTISSDTTLKAVFAQDGSYVARRNGVFYTDADGGLAQALDDARTGDIIVMLEDQELEEDATVPAGVKLYIPYSADFDADGNADGVTTSGSYYQASKTIATAAKTYRTLTINSGVALLVNGTLNIGGVIGYPSQNYQGHTSGWHGKIENNGAIVIGNDGTLDCWGFITGSGTVTAQNGANVYEPFIVYDFAGGWNTVELYFNGQSPFKQYAMQNIQTRLVINSGAKLYARCNLWASSQYNKTDVVFIGEGGLFQLAGGATVTRSYDETKFIPTNADIGKTTYVFNGGMTVNYMTLVVQGTSVSTQNVDFPIPYNTDLVLRNGNYFPGKLKLMPGASLVVESDANLIVDKTLYVLDGLIQSDMSGKSYPSTETLQNAGFSASGQLFVNGTMTVKQGAIFGGVIQTCAEGDAATVTIEQGAIVNKTGVRDGAVGSYDVNTSIFDLPARMYIYDAAEQAYTLKVLTADRTYTSYAPTPWVIDSYAMKYAVDCPQEERSPDIPYVSEGYHKWDTATVPLNEQRTGSWVANGLYYTVKVVNNTVYDPTDSTRVAVNSEQLQGDRAQIEAGGEFVFSANLTESGSGYVYLVTRSSVSGEPVVLAPDAEGNYTISDVEDNVTVTVTACKLGDSTFDGKIDARDLLKIQRIIVGYVLPSPIERVAANTNRDAAGRIDALDLLRVQRYIVGYITAF